MESITNLIAQSKKIEPGKICIGISDKEEAIIETTFQASSNK